MSCSAVRRRSYEVVIAAVLVIAMLFTVASIGSAPPARAGVLPASTISRLNLNILHHVIRKIPTYRPGTVHWRLSLSLKSWGQTNWTTNTISISPLVPLPYLYSVVVHEWSHELSVFDYDDNVWQAIHAMNKAFGGGGSTGVHGTEIAADCMARLQGATWTYYTKCHRAKWRHDARRLVDGHRI